MSPAVSIRKAHAAEVQTLADVGYAAWERDLLPFLNDSPAARQGEKRRLVHAVREMLDRIIVAEVDELAVGWCARARGRAYIPYLFVTPIMQNHGIGTLLLRRMESMLELEGRDRVLLDTLADNVRAVKFYEHQGYHILAMKPDGRASNEGYFSVRLEKQLQPFRGRVTDAE